ncbi:MAG: cobalamin biosynthesis protein [Nitrospinae bacterium]|nr:cobalamin biosynthesis protein [Nitrospinota bacterium]
MKTAVITLSYEGAKIMRRVAEFLPEADLFVHDQVTEQISAERFSRVVDLTARIFSLYQGLVYVAPCGAVVRAIAPHIKDKTTDPAVVQVDVGGRWAVSLLSGHEGGANALAVVVSNAVGAEPVITTSTDAAKNIIVGVGCRKDKGADEIVAAVNSALAEAGAKLEQVRFMASADVKRNERGLLEAAERLGAPLRFISSEEIRNCSREFQKSEFVEASVNIPAVAEPCALLAGRRTSLILRKKAYEGITVAVAKESSLSLE